MKDPIKSFIPTVIFTLLSCISYATGEEAFIAKANKAYSDELYTNAIDLYKQVIKNGYESPDVYFNMGNCFYKLNDIPSSILYYERAKRLNPGDPDINFNLNVANSKIADKIEPLPELFYKRWIKALIRMLPVDGWARACSFTFILSILAGSLYFVSRILFFRKLGFWIGCLLFLFSVFFAVFASTSYLNNKNQNEGIIFTPTVTIKSSPDDKSIDLFVLHEGTKVEMIDHIGDWFEIKIANGSIGWLPASSIERI
jgi:tetratricopeptide (TPR) repeat protein